jgi:hypothetical protein
MVEITAFLVAVSAYLAWGRRLGLREIPDYLERRMAENCKSYPFTAMNAMDRERWGKEHRADASARLWAMTFCWILLLPIRALGNVNRRAIERRDPVLQRQQIADQAKRIAELERDLEIRN